MNTILFFLPFIPLYAFLAVYVERKLAGFIHDRYGPMEVGKYGILQTIADILKLIQKEDIVPNAADKVLHKTAPLIIFVAVFTGFSVLPLSSGWSGANVNVGVFFLMAIVSLDVVGVIMAGWGSNNKYSLFGALRAVAQIVSYEVPLGLVILSVVMVCQTLNLQEMSFQQGAFMNDYVGLENQQNYLFGIKALGVNVTEVGGILTWNIFRSPILLLGFVLFFVASLAECNRAPFDLPESESELVGGFQTEYAGFRWAVIMLAEYGLMLLMSLLGVVLFLGSWNSPLPNIGEIKLFDWTSGTPGTFLGNILGMFWLLVKALFLVSLQMWARWIYPRLRVDQLMNLGWKVLTPLGLLLVLISGVWRLLMVI